MQRSDFKKLPVATYGRKSKSWRVRKNKEERIDVFKNESTPSYSKGFTGSTDNISGDSRSTERAAGYRMVQEVLTCIAVMSRAYKVTV